jgi:uncharacterized lipoprotein YajG
MKRIVSDGKTKILNAPENVNSSVISQSPDADISKQLEEKFQDSMISKNLKVIPLTILPKSWNIWKFQERFPAASNHMIRRAKQLVMDQGIMTSFNPKPGKTLNKVTVEVLKSYYNNDEVTRVIPEKGY